MNSSGNSQTRRAQLFASVAAFPNPNGPDLQTGDDAFAIAEAKWFKLSGPIGARVWQQISGPGGGGATGPADAIGYFDAGGNLTGDPLLTAIPLEQFGRPQIRDIRTAGPLGAVWRQGAWQVDGDATNVDGEGIVIYGPTPAGLQDGANGCFARIKPFRFGIRAIIGGLDIGYMWRVDHVHEFMVNDAGFQTVEIVRDSGSATFKDKLGNDFVKWDGLTTPTHRTFGVYRGGFPVFLAETDGVTRQFSCKDETGANILLVEELPIGAKITAYKPFRPGVYTLAAANALTIQRGKQNGYTVLISDGLKPTEAPGTGTGVIGTWFDVGPAGGGWYPNGGNSATLIAT